MKSAQPGHRTPLRVPLFIGFLLWSLLFIYQSSYLSPDGVRYFCLFDDAMITLRYAWNFAHGNGPVWNLGERVEGYSNPLMLLWMTLAHRLFSLRWAPFAIQWLNVGALWVTALSILKLMNHLGQERAIAARQIAWAQDVALFLFFTSFPVLFWALSGMETPWLTLILLLSVINLLLPVHPAYPWHRDILLGLLLFLGWLTRPDAFIFMLPVGIGIFWLSFNQWPRRRPGLVWGVFIGLVAAHLTFRKIYYGEWLPNTYYLKASGLTLGTRLTNGFLFLKPFFAQMVFTALLVAASIARGPFPLFSILSLLLLAISTFYQLWLGGDAWPMWRMAVPAMPFLFISVGFLFSKFFSEQIPTSEKRRPIFLAVAVLFLSLWQNHAFLGELIFKELPGRKLNYRFIETAIALDEILKPGASVGVFSAGVLPYYLPHLSAVDFLGKNDKRIARTAPHVLSVKGLITLPGHNKYDLSYSILQLKPTFVEQVKWFDDDVSRQATPLYRAMSYRGISLFLLKNSPHVRWEKFRQ